jgi:mannose-1-phosphate guanylyltransferase
MNGLPWAVILAGGDGTRLKCLSRIIAGDDRPKQFCALFGGKTLLERTRVRVARAIPPSRTLFAVVREHERFYRNELSDLDESRIVVQPVNRGTAPAVIYSLLRLVRLDTNPVVAFFPTDHDYADESSFGDAVQVAVQTVHDHSEFLVVLGAQADRAEVEYGWIEPGSALSPPASGRSLYRVNRFREKPSAEAAQDLFRAGCLWNTFVIVGRARTFLDVTSGAMPSVCEAFNPLRYARTHLAERECAANIYLTQPAVDFSRDVLSACAERLAVLALGPVGWSDLGTPERVLAVAELKAEAWLRAAECGSGGQPGV